MATTCRPPSTPGLSHRALERAVERFPRGLVEPSGDRSWFAFRSGCPAYGQARTAAGGDVLVRLVADQRCVVLAGRGGHTVGGAPAAGPRGPCAAEIAALFCEAPFEILSAPEEFAGKPLSPLREASATDCGASASADADLLDVEFRALAKIPVHAPRPVASPAISRAAGPAISLSSTPPTVGAPSRSLQPPAKNPRRRAPAPGPRTT